MQVFVNKSGDGTERSSFDNGNPPLLCSTPKAGLPARISSSAGPPNTRERESDDEVDIQEESEIVSIRDAVDNSSVDSNESESPCPADEKVSLNKMKSFKLQAYILVHNCQNELTLTARCLLF